MFYQNKSRSSLLGVEGALQSIANFFRERGGYTPPLSTL